MSHSPRFVQALAYAAQLHAGQLRKGTQTPYLSHLLAVAAIVLEHGASEDEAVAALLHDAVEDQGGQSTYDEIRHRFGDVVAEIVAGCTDAFVVPKPPWRERKQAHVERLERASPGVRLVTAADKLHNARSILADYRRLGETLWQRFNGGRAGTLWYYRAVTDVLRAHEMHPLVEELDQVVDQLERLAAAQA